MCTVREYSDLNWDRLRLETEFLPNRRIAEL